MTEQATLDEAEAHSHGPTRTFRCVSFAEEMNASRRNTMEDAHRIIPNFDGDPCSSFFAVYDGHGGRGIVDFLESRLDANIARELKATDDATILNRLSRAFLATDVESRQADLVASGATAVTCLIKEEAGQTTIYTANVGDSRAVLCREGKASRLTYDHKAEDEGEQLRVKEAGGFILRNRVLGVLAVTRAFGDHAMKQFIISLPHTSVAGLCASCPFLIMACDGIWDVFGDQEAVQFVTDALASSTPEAEVASKLLREAIARGSTDNVTVIIVFF